jgi:hypothetical protein
LQYAASVLLYGRFQTLSTVILIYGCLSKTTMSGFHTSIYKKRKYTTCYLILNPTVKKKVQEYMVMNERLKNEVNEKDSKIKTLNE